MRTRPLAFAVVAVLARPSITRAQDLPVAPPPPERPPPIVIDPGGWAVWGPGIERGDPGPPLCEGAPCESTISPGPTELWFDVAGERLPDHRMRLELAPGERLRVIDGPLDDARTAGSFVIGGGLALALGAGLALGLGTSCDATPSRPTEPRTCGFWAVSIPVSLVLGGLSIAAGVMLADLDDEPILEIERGATRRRVATDLRPRLGPSVIGAIVVAGAAFGLALPLSLAATDHYDFAHVMLVDALIAAATVPFTITAISDVAGGRGDLVGAVLGSLVGALAIGVAGLVGEVTSSRETAGTVAVPLGVVLSILGAEIGYEITHGEAAGRDALGIAL